MKNKKLLAILLAVFSSFSLAATTLTACGSDDVDPDPDTEQTGGNTDDGGETEHTHTYGDWTVTKIPTETTMGEASRTCTDGDDTQTVTLPKLSDASYTISDITATETEDGTAKYTITINGVEYSFTVSVSATGGSGDEGGEGDEGEGGGEVEEATVTAVNVSGDSATVTEGETLNLNVEVIMSDGTAYSGDITWETSDVGIATVSGGVVTAVSAGSVTITATAGGVSGTYEITVEAAPHTHTYGDWTVTAPTATETGTATRSCVDGDDTQTLTLPVLGDSGYTITKNTATDGEAGTGVYTITVDGVTVSFTAETAANGEQEGVTYISTAEEFIAFRATSSESGLTGTYKLAADIDLSGYTLDDTAVILAEGGVFDGQGYTISNATYAAGSSKVGLLFKTITGGTVTNVKFLNCVVTSTNETAAIVAGECNGTAEISEIEFNACSVTTSGTYAGMIFGRREGSSEITITMSEITAKNGCSTSCSQYGGFLVGDITAGTNLVFKDLDLDGELDNGSGNGSFIAGRTRGGTVSVENAVISATITSINSNGIFSGNGSLTTLTIKNVLILESNISNLYQSSKAPASLVVENLVTISGVTVDSSTASNGEDTATYLKSLGFDFDEVWQEEGEEDGYRLFAASTNVKSADATVVSLKLNTANADTRVKEGGEFSTDGLSVTAVYSDGVQLIIEENVGYTVDHTAVKVDEAGTYTVTVTSLEDGTVIATYEVTVVSETGFVVYDEFVTNVYVAGDSAKFDSANLVVKSVWSDGEEEDITSYTVDATSYDMTTAGTYNVSITYGEYEAQTIAITVVGSAAAVTDSTVEVYVVSTQTDTVTESEGVYTFNTVKDAIDYLEACNYDDEIEKIVHIGAGEYEAKITTSLSHLTLIGENTDTEDDVSVLTYSAVESTVNIVTGGTYGLDCATLQVNGTNLTIKNLTIRNDFDYINESANESSPQGLALTIAGDKAVIENCHLYGNQDTLYLKKGRAYFTNTLIEGNVDFIFGNETGIAYFYQCEIRSISRYAEGKEGSNNGYVTAMKATSSDKPTYGYVFYECDFTDDGKILDGSMSLGRPWGASATVAMINCTFTKAYSTLGYTSDDKTKSRWFSMSGNSPENADFAEYGSTGDGAITEAVNGGRILTEEEAATYTIANVFAAENGLCTWSDSWNGSNDRIAVSACTSDGTVVATISVSNGGTLTAEAVIKAVNAKLASPYEATGVYTDADCTAAYEGGTISTATTLYVTTAVGDLTITESVTYSVANGDFTEVSSGTSYIGNLEVEGSLTANGDWYIVGGTISAKITEGTTISVTVYKNSAEDDAPVTMTVGGEAVTLTLGDDTSKGYVYSYTATADCTVVIAPDNATLYVKTIDINVPIVYTETTTIDLTAYTGEINGTTGEWEGIYIDATNGKFKANGNSVQVNVGTILQIQSVAGATVSIDWFSGYEGVVTNEVDENGLITITVTGTAEGNNTTYIKSITVTVPTSGDSGSGEETAVTETYSYDMADYYSVSDFATAVGTNDTTIYFLYDETDGYSISTISGDTILTYTTTGGSVTSSSASSTYITTGGGTSSSNLRYFTIDLSEYEGYTITITAVMSSTGSNERSLILSTSSTTSSASDGLASATSTSSSTTSTLEYEATVTSDNSTLYLTCSGSVRVYSITIVLTPNN